MTRTWRLGITLVISDWGDQKAGNSRAISANTTWQQVPSPVPCNGVSPLSFVPEQGLLHSPNSPGASKESLVWAHSLAAPFLLLSAALFLVDAQEQEQAFPTYTSSYAWQLLET
jgi:hypothetical protein